ncbi:MAG: hypothetical protein AB7N99_01155 [Simkaniaceae bacterium]|jgi:hypothetical protein
MADKVNPASSPSRYEKQEGTPKDLKRADSIDYQQCMAIAETLKKERELKLSCFSDEQIIKVKEIECKLIQIKEQYRRYIADPSFSENRSEVRRLHGELLKILQAREVNFLKSDIPRGEPSYDYPSEESFRIYEEQVLNTVYNRLLYKNEIHANIKANRLLLLQELGVPIEAPFRVQFLSGETHNGGKKTVIIQYKVEEEIRRFMYKPRDASVDKAVIESFHKINHLPKEQKSSSVLLPEYRIVNLPGGQASVWDYIPGKNLGREAKPPEYAGNVVGSLGDEQLSKKLVRLDDVLGSMNISDIHGENVIMKEVDKTIIDIVPVDLENVYVSSKKVSTKLHAAQIRAELEAQKRWEPLTEEEQNVTAEFREESKNLLVRYIPAGTTTLAGLVTSIEQADEFVAFMMRAFQEDDIELTSEFKELKECFIVDMLQEDVPFFTERGGVIYYGMPERGVPIGKRR